MGKNRSLISELSGVDYSPSTHFSWADQFKQRHPEDYEAVREVIVDWLQGGRMFVLFPAKTHLLKYFKGLHPQIACDPPVIHDKLTVPTFVKLIEKIEHELNNGQKKKSRK